MSGAPNSLVIAFCSASISPCARTSSFCALAAFRPLSFSSARSVAITLPPSAMKASTMARPMPCPAAVTSATLFCNLPLIFPALSSSRLLPVQSCETDFLPAVVVEIFRRQPLFEIAFAFRPFAVEHREPGVVAVAAVLVDHVLAEGPLIDKAIAPRRTLRRGVQRIAFPFVASVTQRLEDVACQEILRFRAERGALQRRGIEDVANFDNPHFRHDPQQGEIADGTPGGVDDGVSVRVGGSRAPGNQRRKRLEVRKWPVGRDVSPEPVMAGEDRPQVCRMFRRELFEMAVAPLERHRTGSRRGRLVLDAQPDRLAGQWMRFGCGHHTGVPLSSLKNLLSSALVMRPAKPSNLPSLAISVAVRMKACMATRASEPPTLMRRTPIAARSATVKPKAPLLRKLTGLGATALTTASICSRLLMPGA